MDLRGSDWFSEQRKSRTCVKCEEISVNSATPRFGARPAEKSSAMSKSVLWFLAVGMVGCTTDPTFETTEEFLTRNNGLIPNNVQVPNEFGHSTSIHTAGKIDLSNEFFQNLGINGRRCISCHLPTAGWGITPEQMQATFDKTDG